MNFWANGMPAGMLLRSPRAASTISDPSSSFTLEAYEAASGTKAVKRVAWETFVAYGKWFQQQNACNLDQRSITEVRRNGSGFKLTLADGEVISSRRVVVAAGIGPFRKTPDVFANLIRESVALLRGPKV